MYNRFFKYKVRYALNSLTRIVVVWELKNKQKFLKKAKE